MFPITKSLTRVVAAATLGLLLVLMLWSISPKPYVSNPKVEVKPMVRSVFDGVVYDVNTSCVNSRHDTFYDDPTLSYTIEKPINNWDKKRFEWLKNHPSSVVGQHDRILIVTGSQPSPCKNPIGDHLLLRLFKNKVDYSRINGYDIFHNNALLYPQMGSYWAKISVVRAAMEAHPESEWIWWVDSDVVFTDMSFNPPMIRYSDFNLVVVGSSNLVYENPNWLELNDGVFYIRNCQWSMDFLEEWAKMGLETPKYNKWEQNPTSIINDKTYLISYDQSAKFYFLIKEDKFHDKVFMEHEHCTQEHWKGVAKNYVGVEKMTKKKLKRRHAEKVNRAYSLDNVGYKKSTGNKWPCVIQFTGCRICSGHQINSLYSESSCRKGMGRALNFADNQVLRNYGFSHPDLLDSSLVSTLSFSLALVKGNG